MQPEARRRLDGGGTGEITEIADTAPRRAPGALAGAAFGLLLCLWFTPSLGPIAPYGFAVGTLGGAGFELFVFALSRAPGRPAVR